LGLTSLSISDPAAVHVVEPAAVPNPNWLRPGIPSAGQQAFGDDLLARHPLVVLPSVVSSYSWNLVFEPRRAAAAYIPRSQERFALDARPHPRPT
jgi:RES domain-containing protein